MYSWQGPAYSTDSAATLAIDVFTNILSLNSSKIQQALINKGLASAVSLGSQTTHYVSSIETFILPNPNKLKECYAELQNQISMFANPDYYTDEQLKDAKANLLRNSIRAKEKPSSQASQMSFFWCSTSLDYFTNQDNNYQKVSREDITRMIKTYITNKPSVAVMVISPEMSKSTSASTFFAAK